MYILLVSYKIYNNWRPTTAELTDGLGLVSESIFTCGPITTAQLFEATTIKK